MFLEIHGKYLGFVKCFRQSTILVIQIEMPHGSCPIGFEQPTKFLGSSDCASCNRLGFLIDFDISDITVRKLTDFVCNCNVTFI